MTGTFPRMGYAELKSQITRAADSIASNIVEGCAAASRQEFARFLDISIKSASEVDYRFQLARDLGVLRHDIWKPLAREVVEIRKMLSASDVPCSQLRSARSVRSGHLPNPRERRLKTDDQRLSD
jgi:four helix bundle protein